MGCRDISLANRSRAVSDVEEGVCHAHFTIKASNQRVKDKLDCPGTTASDLDYLGTPIP